MVNTSQKKLLIIPFAGIGIALTTISIMLYIQGYRINLNREKNENLIKTMGLISAVSFPKSAAVYVNEKLQNTTDSTLTLDPGIYTVKILKDGYLPWQKQYSVKPEIVFTTNASLFRSVPDIQAVTQTGAINPTLSPDGTMILYSVSKATTAKDNGLYRYQTNTTLSLIKSNPEQISPNLPGYDWSKATFEISPDNRKALAYFGTSTILLDLTKTINLANIQDLSSPILLTKLKADWKQLDQEMLLAKLNKLPLELRSYVATDSSQSLLFNYQNDKVIYKSQKTATIPLEIKTSMPAKSTQPQTRDVKEDYFYVYDIQDDTNFQLASSSEVKNLNWIPDTDNIIYTQENLVIASDYDITNKQKVYAAIGNISSFTLLSDGKKLLMLTTPFPGAEENLYTITIR